MTSYYEPISVKSELILRRPNVSDPPFSVLEDDVVVSLIVSILRDVDKTGKWFFFMVKFLPLKKLEGCCYGTGHGTSGHGTDP
jgi:hypothetical protein